MNTDKMLRIQYAVLVLIRDVSYWLAGFLVDRCGETA